MSYNLVDPVTGDLTQVAGGIDTSIIPSDASASNKLATADSTLKIIQLSGSVDCNTLTEPGLYTARAGAVSALTNAPTNSQVQLDGGFSVLVTKTNVDGVVYYGMQMFIPYSSDLPFIRKSYYLNGQHWTDWQQLATMDKVANSIIREDKSVLYNLNNVDNIEVAIDIAKSGYKPIAVSLYNSGTHLWFAQGMYFNDTVCNLSLRGVTPTSATNAECKVLVTYIKIS